MSTPPTPLTAPARDAAGLGGGEAARRLAADGPNLLPGSAPPSVWSSVRGVLTEPMFGMLLAAGGIYLALGDRAEALFLLGFVAAVIGLTLAQERRTQQALHALRELSAPRALVRRDGQPLRIAGRDVVRGDRLLLHEGDRVPADAVLRQGSLSVDESLLTGESVPVDRTAAAEGTPEPSCLHAGTVVTRGQGEAEVTAVGAATSMGRIGSALAGTVDPPSPLQQASHRLVRVVGLAATALAVTQVLLAWGWDGRPLLPSLLSGIALAMAILPEEIPVIMTVFLALGAWRIAREQVLTRRMSAVEALGAITVLAVDKTGTLTVNRMAVAELATHDDARYAADGGSPLPDAFRALATAALLATPPEGFDPMDGAIRRFATAALGAAGPDEAARHSVHEYPLSGELLAVTRVYPDGAPAKGHYRLAAKGAPEAVADLCHLDEAGRRTVRTQVQVMAARGLRVLGVAHGRWQDGSVAGALPGDAVGAPSPCDAALSSLPAKAHDHPFEFLGLIALADPPRPEVPAAVAQCRAAGVRLIMMTGDHPDTARAIAAQVGLSERAQVLTGTEVDTLDDAALAARLQHTDLCARLQPAQKLRLVTVLRGAGEVVAMTGDGVNDAPALKAADVGIAMGQRGTDVAREAAALVLLDDSFAHIVGAIAQGRRIFDNLCRAARFTFAVHMPIVALALVPALLHWPLLLLPVHIVLLELLIDPACSVVFEAEPAATDVMTRPPRGRAASPFDAVNLWRGVLQGVGLAAVLLGGHALLRDGGLAEPQARSVVFAALVTDVLLLTLANSRGWGHRPANPWLPRMAAIVVLALAAVVAVPALRTLMGLAWPEPAAWAALAAMAAAAAAWLGLLAAAVAGLAHRSVPRDGPRIA